MITTGISRTSFWLSAVFLAWTLAAAAAATIRLTFERSVVRRDLADLQREERDQLLRVAPRFEKQFEGRVEVDETFIGGQARYMHKAKRDVAMKGLIAGRSHRTAVVGAIKRGSNGEPSQVVARVIPNTRRATVMPFVREHVSTQSTTLYTDALRSYEQHPVEPEFTHKVIDHAESYVQGDIHTNGAENFWSLVKQMLRVTDGEGNDLIPSEVEGLLQR